MRQAAPYGTWRSPISAEAVAATDGHPNWPGFVGHEVWWSERLPHEGGRTTLMRRPSPGEPAHDVLPAPWSVRSRLMDYGGRAWAGIDGPHGPIIVFVHADDQRLYRFEPEAPDPAPRPLTPMPAPTAEVTFADLVVPSFGDTGTPEVWCVRETTGPDARTVRDLVAVPLEGAAATDPEAVRSLASGPDFVTGPRISPDGRHAAWIGWDHPAMPWDRSRAWVADIGPDRALSGTRPVLGGPGESVAQVEWTDDGRLYAICDRSGWWNVHHVPLDGTAPVNVCPREEEFAGALGKLGLTWCAPLPGGRLAVVHGTHSMALSVLDPATGELDAVPCPSTEWSPLLASDGHRLLAVGAAADTGFTAVCLDTAGGTFERLSTPRASVDPAYLPRPEGRTFHRPGGRAVHAVVFPPRNPGFTGTSGERPPYVVVAHSGPTSRFPMTYDLEVAFFTSRGIGVVAVNYSGSTGYGRAYRDRLRHDWGVADVADCAAVAEALAAEGGADASRLAIRGASAGGWTAAVSLTSLDTYCCAALYYPILDPVTWRESQTGGFEAFYLDTLIGPWPQARDRYRRRSPAQGAARVRAPFLLLQGGADPICPPGQSAAFLEGLPADAPPYRHLVFDGEGHGFKRDTTIASALEAELAMYTRAFGVTEDRDEELVHELVRAQARRTPERPAVRDAEGTWTYRRLIAETERVGELLRRAGVREGDRIGIRLGRSRDLVAAVLGTLGIGCAYVPLDPDYPADRLRFMAEDARLAALLVRRDGAPAPGGEHTIVHIDDAPGPSVPAPPTARRSPGDAALVIYTSGSTGTPKGAVLTHRGISNILRYAREEFGFTPDDSVLALAPFSFDFGQLEILLPLVSGGTVHLADRSVARDPELLRHELGARGATFVMGTPSMFRALTASGWRPTSRLRIVSGGEVLPPSTVRALEPADAVWNIYGPTETSIFSTCERVRADDITIGRPVANTVIEILDGGRRCADGEAGEIHIGGHGLAIGYHERPDLTAERFVADPYRPGERLYRTGDLARRSPDGRIVYEGRVDDQVKIRGHRVEPGEVEERLARHESVRAAAVVAEPGHHSLSLVAYVVMKDGVDADTTSLRPYLARFLPAFALPARVTSVPEIPLGPNGKTDRRALMDLAASSAPSTGRRDGLLAVFRDVLGVADLDPADNFFELGGDSLGAMEVTIRARDLGLRIRPADLYGTRDFAELSALVAGRAAGENAAGPVPALAVPRALSPAQHRFLEWDYRDGDHYNVSLVLDVDEAIDRDLLHEALTMLGVRHPALRLRLGGTPEAPEPYTSPETAAPLSWHTLPEEPAEFRDEADRVQRSLSLRDGPVWRAAFFAGRTGHRLLLVFHHFVADGMSRKTVAGELTSLYASLAAGGPAPSAPPPSWAEHANTLHRFVNGPLAPMLRQWWETLPWESVRPLPADHPGGSMHLSHIRSLRTEMAVPAALAAPEIEALLISSLAMAIAEETGGTGAAVEVCRHGRSDLTGGPGFAGAVGWLNSIAPYVLRRPERASDAELRTALSEQIAQIRAMEQTWGALCYLHHDEKVRRRMAALPASDVYLNFLGRHMHAMPLAEPFRLAADAETGTEMTTERTQPYRLKVYAETTADRLLLTWQYSSDVHTEESAGRVAAACERWAARLRP